MISILIMSCNVLMIMSISITIISFDTAVHCISDISIITFDSHNKIFTGRQQYT